MPFPMFPLLFLLRLPIKIYALSILMASATWEHMRNDLDESWSLPYLYSMWRKHFLFRMHHPIVLNSSRLVPVALIRTGTIRMEDYVSPCEILLQNWFPLSTGNRSGPGCPDPGPRFSELKQL